MYRASWRIGNRAEVGNCNCLVCGAFGKFEEEFATFVAGGGVGAESYVKGKGAGVRLRWFYELIQ
jgi:hypothetical protein